MHPARRTLALAALALGTTLAACSDTGTGPATEPHADPLVQRLNRLADGRGQVLSVEKKHQVLRGVPARGEPLQQSQVLQPCYIDQPCEPGDPPPVDVLDVDAYVSAGWLGSSKYVELGAALYAYADAAFAEAWVSFYSASSCYGSAGMFDRIYLGGRPGPFTESASRYVEYTGGPLYWKVTIDGYGEDYYGRGSFEYSQNSGCF